MGNAGDHCAMGMYLGEEALETCRDMCLDPPVLREYEMREAALRQDCLQMILDNKEFLREEERQEVSVYAAGHGIRLAGKNAFPHFKKLKPSHLPWHLEGVSEENAMREGLSACLRMAEIISGRKPSSLGFSAISSGAEAVPLMEKQGDTYEIAGMLTLMPFLVVFSSAMGIVGAYATAYIGHIMPPDDLTLGLQHSFKSWFVWMSIIKSLFFAFIIASVPAFFGYTVEGGSVNVGKASTDAVVSSSALILFSDVFLTQLLS
jgi:hypothetical protein